MKCDTTKQTRALRTGRGQVREVTFVIYIGNPFVSQAVKLEVKCPRVQCPPLECDEKIAFRPDKKACCRLCPTTTPRSNVSTIASDAIRLPRDQALPSTRRTMEEILSSGGCKYPLGGPYENGMEWHPRLHSHGEMKCVKCRCKVRNLGCRNL